MATASTQSQVTGSLNSEPVAQHQNQNKDGSEEPLMKQAAASVDSPSKVGNLALAG